MRTSQIAGQGRIIGFDMGGTSTDVCHFAGELERVLHTEIAGVRITAPMMMIHTVAAGGGSILSYDGARMRVGPAERRRRSRPGLLRPRRAAGGDRRQPRSPAGCGRSSSRRSSAPTADRRSTPPPPAPRFERARRARSACAPEEVAEGFLRIAIENMANAIKKISVQRGYDVTGYCLTVFGGAGAQHACAIADTLGMTTCLIHPMASLLSAYGMGLAEIRATRTEAVEATLDAASRLAAAALLDGLGVAALGEVEAQGVPERQIRLRPDPAPEGQGHRHRAARSPSATQAAMRAAFQAAHRARFGFDPGDAALVIEAGAGRGDRRRRRPDRDRPHPRRAAPETAYPTALVAPVFLAGGWRDARFVRREALRARRHADRPGGAGRAAYLDPDRARLARPDHRPRPCRAHPHRRPARSAHAIGTAAPTR